MIIIRPCDLETTSLEPTAEVLEIGAYDIRDGRLYTTGLHTLVKPAAPIPYSATGIHHITNEMVADAPAWNVAWRKLIETYHGQEPAEIVFAAHMASYERQYLDALIKARWICTWKCSLRQWPDMESHSLQSLRYALALPADPALAMPPHRALPDSYVCGLLVLELLKHQTIETLIAWTNEPAIFTKLDFGEHNGKPLSEVRTSYFEWMLTRDFSADWKWNAQREIDRRATTAATERAAARQAYVDRMLQAIAGAAAVRDLELWYHNSAEDFANHGILVGSDEYDRLVKACADRKKVLLESGQPQFEGTST